MQKNILGAKQSFSLLEQSLKILQAVIDDLDQVLKPVKASSSDSSPVTAPIQKPKKKKKVLTKAVNSPSEFHSRSFLKSLIANSGRVDRNDGTQAEYDIEESKSLLWEKEASHYLSRADRYEKDLISQSVALQ